MAIPNDIVAKDSGGNIKKVDLTDLLSPYVKSEDIDGLLKDKWPASIKSASLSVDLHDSSETILDFPFIVEAIKLTTASYGSSDIIYEREYEVEQRTIEKSSEAYAFSVSGTGAPFGVCSTKQCFLVLSISGYERLGSSDTVVEQECRASGAHGGNPIILDWASVTLGEGGVFRFSYNDPSQPVGIYGTLNLQRRVNQTGNIHNYDFRLDFVVCGQHAWNNLKNAGKLTLETVDTNDDIKQSVIDLSSITYPKINDIQIGAQSVAFSTSCPSSISLEGSQGISIEISEPEPDNIILDKKSISFALNLDDVAGDGIEIDQNGKLTVPVFVPSAGASNAVPGLVPGANAAHFDDILTVSGWKSVAEIGLDSALKPFIGATQYENGDMGFVPQPLIANAGMFLKGDGTWANAVSEISGTMECDMSPIEKELSFGVSLCDANGEWMFQARQCFVALSPTEVEEGSFEIDIPLADIHGVSLCSPWSAEIPVSAGNNDNGWVADKTFWASAKTGEFSGIFPDGSSIDVWLDTRQDAEIPEKYWTVVHYRVHGCKTQFSRPFLLSIDGTEQECNCSLADDGSTDVATAGSVIKVWPTSAKTRILSDFKNEENEGEEPEEQTSPTETPWGGYIWVNQERTAMLQSGALTYIGDPIHPVYAAIAYQEHPAGSPVLVYGLQEQEDMWDIILQEAVTYNDVETPAETVIGHVWKEGTTVKAASLLFANWSIQPAMQESDEEISLPSDATPEQPDNSETIDEWITLGAEAIYVPSLGLELSKTADGVHVHALAVNIDAWPRKVNSIDLVLDAGFTEEVIGFDCISNWLNTRFEGLDKSLANMERRLQSAGAIFTGATSYSDGLPGLVPPASSADTSKVLMGDGTWSDQFSKDFVGADGVNGRNGRSGLVPAPGEGDADKYLRGDGTWASPVYEFNAVSGVSVLETPAQKIHQTEYDLSSILDQVNALLQQDSQREVYISIPEMEVGLEMPENNGLMIHAVENEGHVCIEIGEIAGGSIVASTVQMPENLENDGNGNLLISWNDSNVEIGASVSIDEQTESLTINSLIEWPLTWIASISGLTIDKTNVVTGEGSLETVDLRFRGATETAPGMAGLAPQPMAGDNERFLRGDGAWAVVSTAKEVALLNEEPDATNTEALDNESIIFYEEQSIQPQTSGLMDISISGNAATSDMLNHPLSVSVDGGAIEGSSLYTFDGSVEKVINLASGSGISLTGVSGTITINANPFRGATSQVNGAAGIVPAAMVADRNRFLRGDGTWADVSTAKEVAILDEEPDASNTATLDNESFIFVKNEDISQDQDSLLDVSISGSAAIADALRNPMSISIDSGTLEGLNRYTFNGSMEKSINLVSGTGITIDALSGTVTINANPFHGATSSANGSAGTVPAPQSPDSKKYLKGDGTWTSVFVLTSTMPTLEDEGDMFFYIDY